LQIQQSETKPDLQIANIYTVPRYPIEGDSVLFLATIINRGTGTSPSSINHQVTFKVNGTTISRAIEFSDSIPAGGMILVCGNEGENNSNYWIAENYGNYNLEAIVDENSLISEINENNNLKTAILKVYKSPPKNIALHKIVSVSSTESSSYAGSFAVDGNYSSRWSSQFSDPQTITIDLGQVEHFNQIKIFWETAFGKEYIIETSSDGVNWTKIIDQKNGYGGIEKWNVNEDSRYIRLIGTKRATEWGYSIYEFEVYNIDSLSSAADETKLFPNEFELEQNYPNPFNPTTKIIWQSPVSGWQSLKIYNILGSEVATLVNEFKTAGKYEVEFNGSGLSSGVYFYTLKSDNFTQTKKLVLLK
jgi:hypothetical protein